MGLNYVIQGRRGENSLKRECLSIYTHTFKYIHKLFVLLTQVRIYIKHNLIEEKENLNLITLLYKLLKIRKEKQFIFESTKPFLKYIV